MKDEHGKGKERAMIKDLEKRMETKAEDVTNLRNLVKEVQHAVADERDGIQQLQFQMHSLLLGANEEEVSHSIS
jgi:hypothetical protein